MIRVLLFDRFDAPIGELKPDEVLVLTRHEAVNGAHSLEITTTRVLEKGWRILTRDARGKWREHVVYGTDAAHEAGERVLGTYYCTWSVQHDLMGTRTSRMPGVQNPVTASIALGYAIEGTAHWQKGTVTNTATAGASMYDMDGWEAVSVLVENWGGEIDATIEVIGDEITARKVDLYSAQGDQDAKRRFDFGADLKSVHRRIADGPLYCRITPRGKGEQTDDGYGRKVRITEVNQGKDYLENSVMVDLAKLPDGNGGWEYPTLEVENSNCETPEQLKEWALTVLDEYTKPNVSYEVDVLQAAAEGIDMQGVSLGDSVQVVDRKFGNGLRITGRVLEMDVNMLDERDAKLTIGNVDKGIVQVFGDLKARLDMVSKTVWTMNGGTYSTAEYLSELLARLNADINATDGYTYITEGEGLRTYDTAVSDPLIGSEANSVVEIKGGTIRIANSKTAQGAWEWKTVFTSGHIAANLVTAAQITTGYIGSAGDTFIDLDNHTVQLGQTSEPHVVVDSSGIKIYNGGTSLGFFGYESNVGLVRVGQGSEGNVVMSGDGYVDIRNASTVMAHFGYGLGKASSGTAYAPYYDIGVRKSDTSVGNYSVAAGCNIEASGYCAYAEGLNTTAESGTASHAEGWGTTASAQASHAEGCGTTAGGNISNRYGAHAEGYQSFAQGTGAHAEGYGTTANADYAPHAEGYETQANASGAHAEGSWTIASAADQHVQGRLNISNSSYAHIVGWGSPPSTRKNIEYLTTSGNLWIAGTLTQNSDRRLKEHHAYLSDDAAEFVRKL
ncbi:MAG: phage tail protein [Eggerthellaceae bacterium]|nr:phage tail protein [Eggerthellaceae bacterium]